MAEIKNINGNIFLANNNRVFFPSANINIFPCSRRGRKELTESITQYDPEARLNTERTNRLHTAVNGFKNSFIINETFNTGDTLIFVLAGYYIEAKNFSPVDIVTALGAEDGAIYAHLSLYSAPLSTEDYFTEILYRQSDVKNDDKYLDISYPASSTDDFFVGVSFTLDSDTKDSPLTSYNLPLFTYSGSDWELVQTSLLPKVEHGETEDSIKLGGNLEVTGEDTTLKKLSAGATDVGSLVVEGTTYLKGTTQIDGEATLYNKLLVKSGNTTRAEIDSSKVSFNLPVTVNDTLQVKRTTGTGPAARVEGSLEVHEGISTETINANTIQSVETLKTDNAKGLVVTSTAVSPEHTLKVEGKTYITDELTAAADFKASGKATIKNLVVGERTSADSTDAGAIIAKTSIKTPRLDVTNHYNAQAYIDNAIITGELSVQNNGTAKITADAVTVTGAINVGTPSSPATADNGGCIVAQYDITAEGDINAGGNLTVGNTAKTDTGTITATKLVAAPTLDVKTIKNTSKDPSTGANLNVIIDDALTVSGEATLENNLNVGTDNDANTGTITAKKLVKAPTLEATTEAKSPLLTVTNKADITNTLNVHNTNNNAKVTADRVQIDKDLIVYDTITATKTFSDVTKNNLNVNKANITTLTTTTVAAATVNSDDLNQKINNAYYDVPVIFVQPQKNKTSGAVSYQLQISRANILPEQQVD